MCYWGCWPVSSALAITTPKLNCCANVNHILILWIFMRLAYKIWMKFYYNCMLVTSVQACTFCKFKAPYPSSSDYLNWFKSFSPDGWNNFSKDGRRVSLHLHDQIWEIFRAEKAGVMVFLRYFTCNMWHHHHKWASRHHDLILHPFCTQWSDGAAKCWMINCAKKLNIIWAVQWWNWHIIEYMT